MRCFEHLQPQPIAGQGLAPSAPNAALRSGPPSSSALSPLRCPRRAARAPPQQVIKWALQASTRETSSFLIEKGKRDARSWVAATGLGELLADRGPAAGAGATAAEAGAERQPGQQQQIILPHGYERRAAASAEAEGPAAAAADGGPEAAREQGGLRGLPEQRPHMHEAQQQQEEVSATAAASGPAMAQDQQQEQAEGHAHHGHKRRLGEGESSEGAGAEPFVPGLTGQPRTDTAPLHDKTPT